MVILVVGDNILYVNNENQLMDISRNNPLAAIAAYLRKKGKK